MGRVRGPWEAAQWKNQRGTAHSTPSLSARGLATTGKQDGAGCWMVGMVRCSRGAKVSQRWLWCSTDRQSIPGLSVSLWWLQCLQW